MSLGILGECRCMCEKKPVPGCVLVFKNLQFSFSFTPTYHHITTSDLKQCIYRQTLWVTKRNLTVNVHFDLKEISIYIKKKKIVQTDMHKYQF